MIPENLIKLLIDNSPGGIGSVIAVWLSHRKNVQDGKKASHFIQHFMAFASGWAIAVYLGGWIIEYYVIDPLSASGIGIIFTTGVMGLRIASEAMAEIPGLIKLIARGIQKWIWR